MLLRWYRRWRLKKSGALFRYYNGERIVWADVLSLYRRIIHHEADIVSLLPAVDKQEEPETSQFLEAVTQIFDLKPYEQGSEKGLTEWEIINVFMSFLEHLDQLKKKVLHGLGPHASAVIGYGTSPTLQEKIRAS
jgi:hypothetical protein